MTSCEGAALANGTSTLMRDPGEPPRPLHHVRTQEEIGCPPTRARASTPHPACRHLDLRLPAPGTLRNECPLFRPPGAWHFCDSGPNGQRQEAGRKTVFSATARAWPCGLASRPPWGTGASRRRALTSASGRLGSDPGPATHVLRDVARVAGSHSSSLSSACQGLCEERAGRATCAFCWEDTGRGPSRDGGRSLGRGGRRTGDRKRGTGSRSLWLVRGPRRERFRGGLGGSRIRGKAPGGLRG